MTPACDCYGYSDAPIVPDLGIFASIDPVALDQACWDAVTAAPGLPNTALGKKIDPGSDKFQTVYNEITGEWQLAHAAEIGLGNREYELIRLG